MTTLSAVRARSLHAARAVVLTWLVATVSLAVPAGGARAADYLLGPQDRLRVKLVEWRPGNGEAIEWEALADDYTVSAAGRIAMPMLGEFKAGGKTPTQLSVEIAEQLRVRVGLPSRPEVSVEVQSYRPFYVLGSVDKPGEYAFRPDLSALQAVGIAGGVYRPADAGLMRLERDRIGALGLLEENRAALGRSLVREARLVGELSDVVDVKLPRDMDGKGFDPSGLDTLVADESAIAKARLTSYRGQMSAADRLKALLDDQIRTLAAKIASQDRQVDISRRELQTYNTLTSQGLAVSSRQFALERALSDAEGKRLDYEMAQLNARQDRQKAEQSQVDLTNDRRSKILDEISEVRGDIGTSRAKVRAQENLVNEASVTTPRAFLDRENAIREQKPIFILTRRRPDGGASVNVVEDTAALEPGDVLKVEVPGLLSPPGGDRTRRKEAEVQ
ncbi:MAG: polysaccharide biosynthesis/export family protein [Methylobacterium sp.]